jgi:hypothetical protein
VVLAVLLHTIATDSLFAPDQDTYHVFSSWLARYWSGDTLIYPWKLLDPGPKAYYYIVASLYYVLGDWSLWPKLTNALLGALTVLLVHDVALRVSGNDAIAFRAATFVAYFPSLVLWSVLNIRDCWVVLLIVLICRQALVLQERFRVGPLVVLALAILTVIQFRDYIFFAVTSPVAVSFLVRNRAHLVRNAVLGMLLAGLIIYADRAVSHSRRVRALDLETLGEIRRGTAVGGSRFEPSADISTPVKALTFLPKGLSFFLLAPFPWAIRNVRQAFTLPEMLVFYSLLPAIVRGIGALLRHRLSSSLMVLMVTLGLTLGYALGEANAGTAYRHRAQVLSFYLIFAAVGLEQRRTKGAALAAPAMQPAA